ncbi:hypothetical protein EJ04DRAFT_515254 [Polyplosphaeria fusca]|uniref:Ribosome assembly protein 3 n=1 Tax=Polyplosphaeria fusca TaxID=682080 RepID=A0A9P4QT62_9PLEO|nr:hypothetical protein EJ04DRAFT_515254 [Polyplosphaeria fusca]
MASPVLKNGAVAALKKKRSKKSKSRTEINLSDSESDNNAARQSKKHKNTRSSPDEPPAANPTPPRKESKKKKTKPEPVPLTPPSPSSEIQTAPPTQPRREEDFVSLYQRKIAAELGDDIEKVRGANDFSDRSVPMLVHALRQGVSMFSAEEKGRVMSGVNV